MIIGKNINLSYIDKVIFDNTDFYIDANQKVALFGINGSGKTSLMKIICGVSDPDTGSVEHLGNLVWVPQEIKKDTAMDSSISITSYLDPDKKIDLFEIKKLLANLELSSLSLDQAPATLSGGQKTRLALAKAILDEPDILLLDEPTNFLDISGKKWLMSFLGKYSKTLVIISHDLDLLDRNIDKVLYINPQTKKIDEYIGNYSKFVHQRQIDEDLLKRHIVAEAKHIKRMQEGLVKMAHFKSSKGVRQRLNLQHRVEKAIDNLPDMPVSAKSIKLQLPAPSWVGGLPIFLKDVNKAYGDKVVLKNLNFDIKRGERIALMGPNGSGKSTLIKIITGSLLPDSGQVEGDRQLKIGYYGQELETLQTDLSLYEYIQDISHQSEAPIRSILAKMLFPRDKIHQNIDSLSGGEKTRLAITALLMQDFNLLILDEPTTFLDPLSQRLILEAIKEYRGSLIFVSHTPEFVEGLNPSRLFWPQHNRFEIRQTTI